MAKVREESPVEKLSKSQKADLKEMLNIADNFYKMVTEKLKMPLTAKEIKSASFHIRKTINKIPSGYKRRG